MADVGREVRRSPSPSRILGLAFALGVHIVVLAVLAWGVPRDAGLLTVSPIDVRLIRLWPRAFSLAPSVPRMGKRGQRTAKTLQAAPTASSMEAATPRPAGVVAPLTQPLTVPGPRNDARLGLALRGSVLGCGQADMAGLSGPEREHCRDLLAAERRDGPDLSRFAVDPVKRAAFDAAAQRALILQQPILADSPKNGCRPLVAHRDYSVGGQSRKEYSIALGCGKAF